MRIKTPEEHGRIWKLTLDSIAQADLISHLLYTFSQTSEFDEWQQQDISMLDFMELHVWMAQEPGYYEEVGYDYERFDPKGYETW